MSALLVPLSRLLTPIKGEPVRADDVYPVAGVYSFGRGLLQRDAIRGAETKYQTMTQLSEGNLVYSKLGAFEGAVALVRAQFAGSYVSPEFPVFQVADDVDRGYLDHLVSSAGFAEQLNAVTTGVGARQKRVSPNSFLSLRVPLPDRPEQRRIAAHLDGLSATDHMAQRARDLANSVLPAARNELFQQVANAPRKPLGELLTVNRTAVDVVADKSYKRIGIYSWGKGFLHREPAPGADLGSMRYFTFPSKALMLSNIQAWEGAVAVTGDEELDYVSSNRFFPYVPRDDKAIFVPFVAHVLLSDWGLDELRRASPGTQVRNRTLGQKLFEAIELPVPSLDDQIRSSAQLDRLAEIGERARRAAELANAILPAARNKVFSLL